jgi:hypothetical protein
MGPEKVTSPGLFPDSQLQGGNIAVAYQDFGVSPDDAVVDPVQEPHAAVAAAQADHPVNPRVKEHGTEVRSPLRIRTGQVLVFVQGVLSQDNPEAEPFQEADSFLNTGGACNRACRGYNAQC